MFILNILKIFLFAAFFFNMGVVKSDNPSYKWSQTIQAATGNVFGLCNNFDFCKNLDNSGIEIGKKETLT
jgi:hypothetical protein